MVSRKMPIVTKPIPQFKAFKGRLLVPQMQTAVETLQYELAFQFAERALQDSEGEVEVLEACASTLLECAENGVHPGESLRMAQESLAKAVEMQPLSGSDKFLSLGQISDGQDALLLFRSGISLMESELGNESPEMGKTTTRRLAGALCSMADIYMTDCCQLPEAESECDSLTSRAMQLDPNSPEVWATIANVRMSQCRTEDAKDAILSSVKIWEGSKRGELNFPSYSQRITTTKILLELSPAFPTLYEAALLVLQSLQSENDSDPEVWYLFAWCYWCLGGGLKVEEIMNAESARNTVEDIRGEINLNEEWDDARECFESFINLSKLLDEPDPNMHEHAGQLLEFLAEFLGEKGEDIDEHMELDVDVDNGIDGADE